MTAPQGMDPEHVAHFAHELHHEMHPVETPLIDPYHEARTQLRRDVEVIRGGPDPYFVSSDEERFAAIADAIELLSRLIPGGPLK